MNYDQHELDAGTEIEREHTHDDALARKIATDHLKSDGHYYSKLKAAGLDEDDMEEGALTSQEAGMEECDTCGCGDPSDDHRTNAAVIVVAGADKRQKPLGSSNLGKGGVNAPLTSTKLEAPLTNKVGPNKVASTKTPPLVGSTITTNSTTDAMDHFGSAIMGLAEGGAKIKKK